MVHSSQPASIHSTVLQSDSDIQTMNLVPTVEYVPFLDIAVCTDTNCQHGVKLDHVARHLRQVHKVASESAAEIQRVVQSKQVRLPDPIPADRQLYIDTTTVQTMEKMEGKCSPMQHSLPLPALPFLPIVKCMQCSKCGLIKQNEESMKRHVRECSSSTIQAHSCGGQAVSGSPGSPGTAKAVIVLAQSIFGGNKTAWFPVTSEHSNTILDLLRASEGSAPGSAADVPTSQMDSFLSEVRFDLQLNTYKTSTEEAFVSTQWSSVPPFPYARKILAAYVHQAFSIASQKCYIKIHTFLGSPLRLALSIETMRTYIGRLSRLLTFLFTVCDWPTVKRASFMTNAQHSEVKSFQQLCSAADASLLPALSKLHIIIRSIMFDPLESNQNVTPLFVACSAVKRAGQQNYRFGTAHETSPMLAALKYLAKCACVTHVYAFPRSAAEREETWKKLSAATSEHADSGATVVTDTLHCCHRLAATESHHINVVLCTRHSMCGIVDGHELSLSRLAAAVHSLQESTWALIGEHLLMGLHLNSAFWDMLGTLQDALGEKSPGYWYLMHPHNYEPLNAWRRGYINAVHPKLFNADATVKSEAGHDFISHALEFQKCLYTLMQICSGGPARATEAAVMRIRNTAMANRSIFVSQGQILTIMTYSKTRCVQDGIGRSILRCPDAITAGLLHIYLIFIHPMRTLIASKLKEQSTPTSLSKPVMPRPDSRGSLAGGSKELANPLDFMYDSDNPDGLRTAFTDCLRKVDISLNTTQYRHYHSAVVKNFLPSAAAAWNETDRCTADAATMHLQAGHSEPTATKTYGVTHSQLTSITATQVQKYRTASETWHRVLRLQSGKPIPVTQRTIQISSNSPCREEKQDYVATRAPTAHSSTAGTRTKQLMVTAQLLARLDCIENNLNILLSRDAPVQRNSDEPSAGAGGASSSGQGYGGSGTTTGKRISSVRDGIASAASVSLQTFLQSPEANFSSPEQRSAVLHALQPGEDFLVVLPTGGGKSLIFMLPAFMNPDRVCVVIVPLVALQEDLIARCAAKGITAARFTDVNDTAGVRVVLVSAEHLVLPGYAAFLRTQVAKNALHAIFVDEAHLVVLWRQFRTALQDVREFIRPHDVDVSIISMTATCPPPLEKELCCACGMRDWEVTRSRTTRRNIRYSVQKVAAGSLLLTAAQIVARIAAESDADAGETRMILYIENKARCNSVEHVFSLICPDIQCLLYHADLTDAQRSQALRNWQTKQCTRPRLMVATSAFGCGIDVPSVRCVVHLGLPRTVMDFLQESGRAGRDGLHADSVILHPPLPKQRARGHNFRTRGNVGRSGAPSQFGDPSALCTTVGTDCRRWFLDKFADGTIDRRSCQARHLEPCDHCSVTAGDERSKRRRGNDETGSVNVDEVSRTLGLNAATDVQATHQQQSPGPGAVAGIQFVTANQVLAEAAQEHKVATPAELRELAERFLGSCPPCSVATKSIVRHTTQSVTCFNNICLRCCASGHKASVCANLSLTANSVGCYTCTLNKVNGVVVHNVGTYGKRSCQLRAVFCFCICLWESEEHKQRIHDHAQYTQQLQSTTEFVDWLRSGTQYSENSSLGILHMVPLLNSMFFGRETSGE